MTRKVVHLIHNQQFICGYIDLMKNNLFQYEHFFVTYGNKNGNNVNCKNIAIIKTEDDLDKSLLNRIIEADKIVVSGVFDNNIKTVKLLPLDVLKRTYFHFWGGDYYRYRDIRIKYKSYAIQLLREKYELYQLINNSAGIINLTEYEWADFKKIFHTKISHFCAPMPPHAQNSINCDAIRAEKVKHEKIRILVGNSSTKTNRHIPALKLLQKYANENIEILVPLSYGNPEYKQEVIECGKKLFGEKFVAIEQFMDREEYVRFLNSCDVGVFNNDRQQGMGNIGYMLELGKKVYMPKDEAMWKHFTSYGITLYDVNEISQLSCEDFVNIQDNEIQKGIQGIKAICNIERQAKLWDNILG